MRIYISGAITNAKNPKAEFDKAEKRLHEAIPNAEIINPYRVGMGLEDSTKLTWSEYMSIDLGLLQLCDTIYFIDGWENSKGCLTERINAIDRHMTEICFTEQGAVFTPMTITL